MSKTEKYILLEKKYNSLVGTTQEQQTQINSLHGQIGLLNSKLMEAQQQVIIKQTIMANALGEQNKIKDAYSEEIRLLRDKITELEG